MFLTNSFIFSGCDQEMQTREYFFLELHRHIWSAMQKACPEGGTLSYRRSEQSLRRRGGGDKNLETLSFFLTVSGEVRESLAFTFENREDGAARVIIKHPGDEAEGGIIAPRINYAAPEQSLEQISSELIRHNFAPSLTPALRMDRTFEPR